MIDVASIKVKLPQQQKNSNMQIAHLTIEAHCFVAFVGSHAYVNIIAALLLLSLCYLN